MSVVRTWLNTWPSKIQAKLSGILDNESNLETHILLFIQIYISETDSNSP